jgi:hypothetical protein
MARTRFLSHCNLSSDLGCEQGELSALPVRGPWRREMVSLVLSLAASGRMRSRQTAEAEEGTRHLNERYSTSERRTVCRALIKKQTSTQIFGNRSNIPISVNAVCMMHHGFMDSWHPAAAGHPCNLPARASLVISSHEVLRFQKLESSSKTPAVSSKAPSFGCLASACMKLLDTTARGTRERQTWPIQWLQLVRGISVLFSLFHAVCVRLMASRSIPDEGS